MLTIFDLLMNRCDHCLGPMGECEGVTLYGAAGGHPHEEDVSICRHCASGQIVNGEWISDRMPSYWRGWLDSKFAKHMGDAS